MPRKCGPIERAGEFARRRLALASRVSRRGAVFSIEMMMLITILIPMMFALTEFSLLWSARHTLQAAAFEASRAASMPCPDDPARFVCAKEAAEAVFANERYLDTEDGYFFDEFDVGTHTGDMVHVKLKLPMMSASPDLLGIIGVSIEDKFLTAEAVTRRQ